MEAHERLFGEVDAAIFGSTKAWEDSRPERHWVRSEAGWSSHDRRRCKPDTFCTEIKMPPEHPPWPKPPEPEASDGQ